jgi:hypothetical protein
MRLSIEWETPVIVKDKRRTAATASTNSASLLLGLISISLFLFLSTTYFNFHLRLRLVLSTGRYQSFSSLRLSLARIMVNIYSRSSLAV